MLCENCNKNVATVHLVEIINQEKKEVNLCENCAQEAGLPFSKPTISVSDLFGLVEAGLAKAGRHRDTEAECPQCGMTLREFRVKGRLGCPNDYEIFRSQLEGLLEKIHGAFLHVGKRPKSEGALAKREKSSELETLRERLGKAVEEEEYEEAARLRDRISELEKKSKTGTEK